MSATACSLSLRAALSYEPQVLRFGTSGRRGPVVDLTQLEVYINATAELEYLQSLPQGEGGIGRGDEFYFAHDLRPSSTRRVAEQGGRGELAQAIQRAIADAGMRPVNLGVLPTPALMAFACQRGRGSMMVTGSHIPFDRNGYKTNSSCGELLKRDEGPINERVERVRGRLYQQPARESIFDGRGCFKSPESLLSPAGDAAEAYMRRYTSFFGEGVLKGLRLVAYQHSAVGRDLLVELLRRLGAEVVPAGRSDIFVPIDTEAIDAEQLAKIQLLARAAWEGHGPIDAVVSTDGDSDRPLVVGVEAGGEERVRVRFFGGDLVGMVVAELLAADAVVVPISCNDAIDRGPLKGLLEPKTRIGSPHVIAAMQAARARGRQRVCGWEANGGFLTGSDIERDGRVLPALPTRDAMLPIVATLVSARAAGRSLSQRFDELPRRFSKASLLRNFPRAISQRMLGRFAAPGINEASFSAGGCAASDAAGKPVELDAASVARLQAIRGELAGFFTAAGGFGEIVRINYTDGVRLYFGNGDVAHLRPSGNADELRIYAVADTQGRAEAIAAAGTAEPDGILRQLERAAG